MSQAEDIRAAQHGIDQALERALDHPASAIDPADLPHHQRVVQAVKDAQTAFHEAAANVTRAEGAIRSWAEYLAAKHALNIAAGDMVQEDGTIVRAE